jgi:hypothetical protein
VSFLFTAGSCKKTPFLFELENFCGGFNNLVQKLGKSSDHTYAWNSLTNFEYAVHAVTGNGNIVHFH